METVNTSYESNPSIAYKHFNFEYVDFIWMEEKLNYYEIYYMRDEKHIWLGIDDEEDEKGFTISGHPNPFSEILKINVTVESKNQIPQIEIYNSNSQLIRNIVAKASSTKEFVFNWDGTSENGKKVKPGVYVLMCTAGDKRTARKVIYKTINSN
jgi:hypothetical protein